MATLFSYCIPTDDGAAPNPYWGVCSLAICKPKIRKKARLHDWIVGTGSKNSPIGDISNHVVYTMRVTRRVTMRDYDRIGRTELPGKIPDWENTDVRRRVGDSIYDFSTNPATIRRSVHDERNRKRDLSGEYVLLSTHFYYFGDRPIGFFHFSSYREGPHGQVQLSRPEYRINDQQAEIVYAPYIQALLAAKR